MHAFNKLTKRHIPCFQHRPAAEATCTGVWNEGSIDSSKKPPLSKQGLCIREKKVIIINFHVRGQLRDESERERKRERESEFVHVKKGSTF